MTTTPPHTYSIVVHHGACVFSLQGCTFLTVEDAYDRLMADARTYTPRVRKKWREVVQNYFEWDTAVLAMGVVDRRRALALFEAVSA